MTARFWKRRLRSRARNHSLGKLEGIVIDDEQAVKSGGWNPSRANSGFLGSSYLHDQNARDGKATATFRVDVPAAGAYNVRVLYPTNENRATNAPVTIACDGATIEAKINERREPVWLGPCKAAKSFTVTVSNKGTDGFVVARWSASRTRAAK